MLSENQVVTVRRALERMYTGRCSVWEKRKVVKANKATGYEDVLIMENQPCRLSFTRSPAAVESENISTAMQEIRLFLTLEPEIKAGSKITVTQNGVTEDYAMSGQPIHYATHQEIVLALFRKEA